MAKITIEIDTHDADETDKRILSAFSTRVDVAVRTVPAPFLVVAENEMSDADAEMYAEDEASHPEAYQEPAPPKRTRRTKAQMEADAAPRATEVASSTASEASGPTVTATVLPVETASTPDGEMLPEDVAGARKMINDRIRHYMGQGIAAAQLVKIIKDHAGVSSANLAEPATLPAIWETLVALAQA